MINEHSIHFRWIQLIQEFIKPPTQKELSELTSETREGIQNLLQNEGESTEQYKQKVTQEKSKVASKLSELKKSLNGEIDKYEEMIKERAASIKEDFQKSFNELNTLLEQTKEAPQIEKFIVSKEAFKSYIEDVITQENHQHENIVARKYDEVRSKLNALSLLNVSETKEKDIIQELENPKQLIRYENEIDKFEFFKRIYKIPLSKHPYASLKNIRTIATPHKKAIYKVVFLDDETRFATCSDDATIMIWDISKDEPIKELHGHNDRIWNLIKLHNGNLVSSSSDKSIKLWDPYKGKCEKTFSGHTDFVSAIVELPRLNLLSGSHDKTLRFWDLKLKESDACIQTIKQDGQGRIMTIILLNPSEMACGSEKNINIYKIDDGILEKSLVGHNLLIRDLYLLEDGTTLLSSSDDKTLKMWNWVEGTCTRTFTGHGYSANKIVMFNPGVVASASDDHSVKFWKLDTGACVNTITAHDGWVIFITIMHDGTLVSCGADKAIKFWGISNKDETPAAAT
jgi:WD40 repeat protein